MPNEDADYIKILNRKFEALSRRLDQAVRQIDEMKKDHVEFAEALRVLSAAEAVKNQIQNWDTKPGKGSASTSDTPSEAPISKPSIRERDLPYSGNTQREAVLALYKSRSGEPFDVKQTVSHLEAGGYEFTSRSPKDPLRGCLRRMADEGLVDRLRKGFNVYYGLELGGDSEPDFAHPDQNPASIENRSATLLELMRRYPKDRVWNTDRAVEAWREAGFDFHVKRPKSAMVAVMNHLSEKGILEDITPEGTRVRRFRLARPDDSGDEN